MRSEFQTMCRVHSLVRKEYELLHPNWEEEMKNKPIDKPKNNDYINEDSIMDEVNDILSKEGVL